MCEDTRFMSAGVSPKSWRLVTIPCGLQPNRGQRCVCVEFWGLITHCKATTLKQRLGPGKDPACHLTPKHSHCTLFISYYSQPVCPLTGLTTAQKSTKRHAGRIRTQQRWPIGIHSIPFPFNVLSVAAWHWSSLWGKSVTSRCITVQRRSRGLLKGPRWWASSDCLVTACQWWAALPMTHGWSIRAYRYWSPTLVVFLDLTF